MAQGTTTVNFGAGSSDASVFVSAPTITSSNLVEAWIFPTATTNNEADCHWVEDLTVIAGNIVNSSGFTIYAKCNTVLAHGIYTIAWVFA
jgi:hypothetical protein